MRILQLSIFYRNDKTNGFGFTLTEDFGDLLGFFSIIKTNYDLMYAEASKEAVVPELLHDLWTQLDQLVRVKNNFTDVELTIAIGNLYLLQQHGHLTPDEFNGLLFLYSGSSEAL